MFYSSRNLWPIRWNWIHKKRWSIFHATQTNLQKRR